MNQILMDVSAAWSLKIFFDKKNLGLTPSSADNKSFCSVCSVPLVMNHGVYKGWPLRQMNRKEGQYRDSPKKRAVGHCQRFAMLGNVS